jgi:3-hydroxyacyl-CoA dehydrogenase
VQKIGIVGAGLIGRAWAIVFARAGHPVAICDTSPEALRRSVGVIDASLRDLQDHGLLDDPDAALARITPVATLAEAVAGAAYVQENGPERVEDKRAIFAELDRLAAPEAVLASSTSAILPALFTEDLAGRARCLVAHPVNPPHLVPLVELCAAPWTAPEAVDRARVLLDGAGQVPILVRKEIEGFILNRLQGALLNEAWRLIDEGYVSAADLDKTVSHGLGLRWSFMGPMETIDLNAPAGLADYMRRYGPFYRRIAEAARTAPLWRESLADRLEAERRAELATDRLPARQAWRDRRLMALLRHKTDQENAENG